MVTDPSGRYAYFLEVSRAQLSQWHLERDSILRDLSPLRVYAHSHPSTLRFHPSGHFAYVSCSHGAICQYRVHSGALIPLKPLAVYADDNPSALWFDRTSDFACVITHGEEGTDSPLDRVYLYRVRQDGCLNPVRQIEVPASRSKITQAAWNGKIPSFTISGSDLSR